MRRLDLHAHVIPDAYRDLLVAPDGTRPPVARAELEDLQANLERYRIDAAAISTGPPGAYVGDRRRAVETARAANEALAAISAADPQRFAALALLPLPDPDAALAELGHAFDHLRLDGVMLLTNVAGTYLGDRAWDPLYAELDRRGAYVFVHPTIPPYAAPMADDHPAWLYEFPFETTRAIANLIFSGTLGRHPAIRFQFAHLGGTVPFLAERIGSLAEREPERAGAAPAGVAEYLSRQFFDTGLTQTLPAIEATRSIAPLEQIVFGTDWPYAALPAQGNDPAPALASLPAATREAIDAGNAAVLVPRWGGAGETS
jgi:predicted TIM-barrel fold metal-dependent hydrolase